MIQIDPTKRPDIHAVAEYSAKALATFAALEKAGGGAAHQPAGGAPAEDGASEAAAAISDCMIVMEAVGDKLKLLG